jgi:hypothetical protein
MLFGQNHVNRYVETNGEEGYNWNGAAILILTTTGRRSGAQHSTRSSSGGTETSTWSWHLGAAPTSTRAGT